MMRILFVGKPDSIHTARWISQITNQNWEIYLFPVYIGPVHPAISDITVFGSLPPGRRKMNGRIRFVGWTILLFWLDYILSKLLGYDFHRFVEKGLTLIIRWLHPDIVHSFEIPSGGYLTLAAKEQFAEKFPTWIATNWGSDIHLFGRLAAHKPKIQAVLKQCDYYSCECQRDVILAKELGLKGQVLPVLPNTGGLHIRDLTHLINAAQPSKRRKIILKGYQHFAGRALVGLQALRQCADQLAGYCIMISSASADVSIAAEIFQQDAGIPAEIIPPISHAEMLQIYGAARIYIGLSISDAISTSLLEAMAMGAFPIQSCTACADEWIEDGVSGIIVPPEDPYRIADAIRRALADDALVDQAAEINAQTVLDRLDYAVIQAQVIQMYQQIYGENLSC